MTALVFPVQEVPFPVSERGLRVLGPDLEALGKHGHSLADAVDGL